MATYTELKRQLDALAVETEAARKAEVEAVIAEMRAKAAEYGLEPHDIFPPKRGRRPGPEKADDARRAPVPPKYQDPKTGATWSGRGKPPAWIAAAKNRDRFLIKD
jgi:DNA-binding protein H-NS